MTTHKILVFMRHAVCVA